MMYKLKVVHFGTNLPFEYPIFVTFTSRTLHLEVFLARVDTLNKWLLHSGDMMRELEEICEHLNVCGFLFFFFFWFIFMVDEM